MAHTRWCVITGPPCSGKTTLIHDLEALGHPVVHEVARAIIWEGVREGLTPTQVRARNPGLQQDILNTKLEIEEGLPHEEEIFLDRGIPDSIAYFELAGLDPTPVIAAARRHVYRLIFFLEPLGRYRKDPVRHEPLFRADELSGALKDSYTRLGYHLTPIPATGREERLSRVLMMSL